jgi:hypothetical protein
MSEYESAALMRVASRPAARHRSQGFYINQRHQVVFSKTLNPYNKYRITVLERPSDVRALRQTHHAANRRELDGYTGKRVFRS